MREIKFRTWKTNRKPTMLYSGQFDIEYSDEKKRYQAVDHTRFDGQWDMPLMQFTGLKDKNGKEIYEGDIVQNDNGFPYEIRWQSDICAFVQFNPKTSMTMDMRFNSKEVIGNIYENPELLK